MMKRGALYIGGNLAAYLLVVVGLVVVLNYIAVRHKFTHDLTAAKRHTLSAETVQTLRSLPHGVHLTAFVKDDPALRQRPRILLQQYADSAKQFSYEFADPDKNPAAARRFGITEYDSFALEGKDGHGETITGGINEEKLTNALVRITHGGPKTLYFVSGHGERSLEDNGQTGYGGIALLLEGRSYRPLQLELVRANAIPDDAAAVVIAAPKTDLTGAEQKALDAYLQRGGRLLFLAEPFTLNETPAWLRKYGIALDNNIIIDNNSQMAGGDALAPIATEYGDHPVTKGFNVMTVFPTARSVAVKADGANKPAGSFLVMSGAESWGETDEASLRKKGMAEQGANDLPGPLAMAAAASLPNNAAIAVFGDADFAANAYLNLSGNRDLFLNTVNWLALEEDRIIIARAESEADPLIFSSSQLWLLSGIAVLLIPGAVAAAGIVAVVRRRRS